MIEGELLQGLVPEEPRALDPQRGAGGFTLGDFPGENRNKVFLMGPPGGAGGVGQAPLVVPDPWCPQRPGVVLNIHARVRGDGDQCAAPVNSKVSLEVEIPKAWSEMERSRSCMAV